MLLVSCFIIYFFESFFDFGFVWQLFWFLFYKVVQLNLQFIYVFIYWVWRYIVFSCLFEGFLCVEIGGFFFVESVFFIWELGDFWIKDKEVVNGYDD